MSDSESDSEESDVELLVDERELFPLEGILDDDEWQDENAQMFLYYEVAWDNPALREPEVMLPERGPPFVKWKLTSHGQSAVEVGRDTGGGMLYVGRAMHAGHILPVKVAPEHQGAFLAWGGVEHSRFHGNFEVMHLMRGQAVWEAASDGDVPANAFPVGCTAQGHTVFAARARHADTLTLGRLIPNEEACYISYGGEEIGFKDYEVLTIT